MDTIWKGSISFGLVNIPIALVKATESSKVELNMLDKTDHAKVKIKKVNENTGKEVPFEDQVKGYKLHDEYIVLEDEDFIEAAPKKTKMIELENFVDIKEIDPMYFEDAYFAVPEKTGKKAYSLLHHALEKTQRAGIARFVLSTREHICLIRPLKNGLLVQQIRFPEEVRSMDTLSIEKQLVSEEELDAMIQYIEENSEKLDVTKYHNEYSEKLLARIKEKAKGKSKKGLKIVKSPSESQSTKSDDLMKQLMESLKKPKAKKA